MRQPKFYSASNIGTFFQDKRDYYLKYLSDNKVRDPQTPAMALGSAFDARIKAYLHKRYVGNGDPEFEFDNLFVSQVEEQNRDILLETSKIVYKAYVESGALKRLCVILDKAEDIGMEYRLEGDIFGVPFCGYPDLTFSLNGQPVIFDFKVNGYFSKNGIGPKKYYSWIEGGLNSTGKPLRGDKQKHKDAVISDWHGLPYCSNFPFELVDEKWAFQMMIYHWLKGVDPCDLPLIGIEQISCQPNKIRVAQFRGMVSNDFIANCESKIKHVYNTVTTLVDGYPHIFENLSKEDNDLLCVTLDGVANIPNETDLDQLMNSWEKKSFGF